MSDGSNFLLYGERLSFIPNIDKIKRDFKALTCKFTPLVDNVNLMLHFSRECPAVYALAADKLEQSVKY